MKLGLLSRHLTSIAMLLLTLLLVAACSSSDTTETGDADATTTQAEATQVATATVIPAATQAAPAAEVSIFDDSRSIGVVDGMAFMVTNESEVTFTVGEQLTRLPLPNDAVMRTNALSGEVYLDGRPSSISFDIHTLQSDQTQRDNWVRTRMFPDDRIATFILGDATPLPNGFTDGDTSAFTISGLLEIRGLSVPLDFEIEARDDGDVLFILGRTTFEWSDIEMDVPNSRGTISVENEVQVEVLLKARPLTEG
jgi:hypothetical protein